MLKLQKHREVYLDSILKLLPELHDHQTPAIKHWPNQMQTIINLYFNRGYLFLVQTYLVSSYAGGAEACGGGIPHHFCEHWLQLLSHSRG